MAFWQTGQFLIEIEGAVPETHHFGADSLLTGITVDRPSIVTAIIEIGICQESLGDISPVGIVGINDTCV